MAEEAAEHALERYDKPWPSDKNRAVGSLMQTREARIRWFYRVDNRGARDRLAHGEQR